MKTVLAVLAALLPLTALAAPPPVTVSWGAMVNKDPTRAPLSATALINWELWQSVGTAAGTKVTTRTGNSAKSVTLTPPSIGHLCYWLKGTYQESAAAPIYPFDFTADKGCIDLTDDTPVLGLAVPLSVVKAPR
jgi:hypothetical protein